MPSSSPTPLPAATSQPPAAPPVKAKPATVTDAAKSAVSLITEAQNALPLETDLTGKTRASALRLQLLPASAIAESARILEAEGHRFPSFDATLARDAADFEAAMTEVVSGATALIGKAKVAILQHRAPAAEQTLALYAVLKGASRTDASLVEPTKRLEPLVNTRKNPHQTKKQQEEAKAKAAQAAAAGAVSSSSPSPAPATPAVEPPSPAPASPTPPVPAS